MPTPYTEYKKQAARLGAAGQDTTGIGDLLVRIQSGEGPATDQDMALMERLLGVPSADRNYGDPSVRGSDHKKQKILRQLEDSVRSGVPDSQVVASLWDQIREVDPDLKDPDFLKYLLPNRAEMDPLYQP